MERLACSILGQECQTKNAVEEAEVTIGGTVIGVEAAEEEETGGTETGEVEGDGAVVVVEVMISHGG